jgi:hypothetical protein
MANISRPGGRVARPRSDIICQVETGVGGAMAISCGTGVIKQCQYITN